MNSSIPASWYGASRSTISSGGQMMRFASSSSIVWRYGSGSMHPRVTTEGLRSRTLWNRL